MNIQAEIQALRTATTAELVDRYHEVFGKPPRVKQKAWLWKRIAWKIQEQQYGGLSAVAKQKLQELIAGLDLPFEATRTGRVAPRPPTPMPGTVLTRMWRGQEIRVLAVEGGFEWDGGRYRSLSAVARAVTGTRWNGRLFFGLTPRRKS